MIRLESVGFHHPGGVAALSDVDLDLARGGSLGLIGANGSGKSTLLRLLNGLLRPSTGRVLVDGRETRPRSVAELSKIVGLAFQEPDDQIFRSTVRAEVAAGATNRAAAERALEMVGLADRSDEHPHDLGYSRRKLLAIAAVLAMETAVVALDEPTTGQDAEGRRTVGAVVRHLLEAGRTVIVAGHDRRFMADHLERTLTVAGGRLR